MFTLDALKHGTEPDMKFVDQLYRKLIDLIEASFVKNRGSNHKSRVTFFRREHGHLFTSKE